MATFPERPTIQYARSGDVSIAYQVFGEDKPIDLVWAPGTVSHLALDWERRAAFNRRFSPVFRLIRFGKRRAGVFHTRASTGDHAERKPTNSPAFCDGRCETAG